MKVPLKRSHWNGSPFLKRFFPSEGHVMVKQRSVFFFKFIITHMCVYEKTRGRIRLGKSHDLYREIKTHNSRGQPE